MAISSVASNMSSMFIQNQLVSNRQSAGNTAQQLASGQRINSAADDAAGLSISTGLDTQTRGIQQAIRNTNDGVSFLQVADGALAQSNDILQRMRELSIQSANGIYNANDQSAFTKEYDQLFEQLSEIQEKSSFNGRSLFGDSNRVDIQTGEQSGDTLEITTGGFDLEALASSVSGSSSERLAAIDQAAEQINSSRADIGSSINRLSYTADNLATTLVNTAKANSQIMDTDYAAASSERAKNDIQNKVQIAMLAQANAQSGQVLRLLGE